MNDLNTTVVADTSAASPPSYTLWQLVRYMLALGTWGFGGPVALAGYMYRDLVEKHQWITDADYKEGLALAQLMPGPLAAQLAIYSVLTQIMAWCGKPQAIRCDNGLEYIRTRLLHWAGFQEIRIERIQLGKHQQNAYVERFNRTVIYERLSH